MSKVETQLKDGEEIKQLRKNIGLTQNELAIQTGISRSVIASYENGSRSISQKNVEVLNQQLSIVESDITKMKNELLINLEKYQKKTSMSNLMLASVLKVDPSLLIKIRKGVRKPSNELISKIQNLLSESSKSISSVISDQNGNYTFPVVNKEEMGKRVHQIRKLRNESLAIFGKNFTRPVGKNVVSRWEKGINIPDIERLMNIAFLGETTPSFILYGDFYRNMLNASKKKIKFEKLDPVYLGRRLRKIRKERKLEREEFGLFFDPSIRKWSMDRYENGKDIPNTERLMQYAFIGEVSIEFLIYGK